MVPREIVWPNDERVSRAEVQGTTLPPQVRTCIARAAEGATIRPFTQPNLSVSYPFQP